MKRSLKKNIVKWASYLLPEELYLKVYYKRIFKRDLNLNNPETYNEKLQWLKLHDHNPLYTKLVDKYAVREYVSDHVGEKYLIPLFGVWDTFEEIQWEKLPNQFVLKTTHDSGTVIVCHDKSNFNVKAAEKIIKSSLRRNYYLLTKEWPYRDVKPRIIAEKYMHNKSESGLKDYKFFCFNGDPKFCFVASDRDINQTKFDFFDMKFNSLNISQHYPRSAKKIICPSSFNEMIEISKKLSKGLIHVRVDLYEVDRRPYFGELTFYHFSGLAPFDPPEVDKTIGDMLILDELKQ